MDFGKLAQAILTAIGGEENISGFTHCATRLRFTLKDDSRADDGKVKAIKGVLGVAHSGGQFQIIIGPEVPKAFAAIQGLMKNAPSPGGEVKTEKSFLVQPSSDSLKTMVDLISNCRKFINSPDMPISQATTLLRTVRRE